ncbi:MAG: tetratricopeptide repeat protein [Myxococcales bacterium]|nr:tetratricopeptide repeat protein [Myxococcales bacterium]MCB9545103.1 tetratricopeptide repeat protein [Myxococcales bacterium]
MKQILVRLLVLAFLVPAVAPLAGCNRERNESIRMMNKGLALYRAQRTPEAIKELEEAVRTDPKNDKAYLYLGMIQYQRLGDLGTAEKNLRRAIELKADAFEAHYHLGATLSRKDEWKAAAGEFEEALKLRPDHAESHLRLGYAMEQLDKYDRAQEAFHEAIRANPRLPEAYNALGNLYRRFEKYSHAAQVLKNAVENNPGYAANYHDLGLVYQEQKRFDDAISQLEKARTLDPSNPTILFNLGMTYLAAKNGMKALDNLRAYVGRRTASEDAIRVQTARDIITRLEAGLAQ